MLKMYRADPNMNMKMKKIMKKGARVMHSPYEPLIAPAFKAVKKYLEKESARKAGTAPTSPPEKMAKRTTKDEEEGYPKIEKPEDLNPFTKWIENEKHKKELAATAAEEMEKAKHEEQARARIEKDFLIATSDLKQELKALRERVDELEKKVKRNEETCCLPLLVGAVYVVEVVGFLGRRQQIPSPGLLLFISLQVPHPHLASLLLDLRSGVLYRLQSRWSIRRVAHHSIHRLLADYSG